MLVSLSKTLRACNCKFLQMCCGNTTEQLPLCAVSQLCDIQRARLTRCHLCCVVCGAGFLAGSTTDALPSESSTGSSQPSLTPSPGTCCLEVIALHYTDTTHVMDSRSRFITYRHFIFHSYQSDRIIPVSYNLGPLGFPLVMMTLFSTKYLMKKKFKVPTHSYYLHFFYSHAALASVF